MNKEARYLLASVVESSQDSIVTIDLNRNITSWNKAAEGLYGYTAEEIIGKPLSIVLLPDDIKDLIGKVENIIQEVTVPIYETIRVHKNGRHADLEILLSPVRNDVGKTVGISTVARDITVRKMNEKQKDDFIGIASHELKSPLTSIKSYTELLLERLEDSADEVSVSMATKLNNQIDRLIDLVKTLLDTTKLTAGEVLLDIKEFNLNELIDEQIEALRPISANHDIIFEAGNIRTVAADRKVIRQVITNLVTNAVKYSPQQSKIIVSTSGDDAGIKVSVTDYGVGIPAILKDKIFDRYYRVSNTLTANSSGLGLGLYITAQLVYQHGGTIVVESEEGKGSTFLFTLPYRSLLTGPLA